MRGLVFTAGREVELMEFPDPTTGPGEVVAIKASGMCGDRVMVHHAHGCDCCRTCRSGWPQMCDNGLEAIYGITANGGHAPYLKAAASNVVRLPDRSQAAGHQRRRHAGRRGTRPRRAVGDPAGHGDGRACHCTRSRGRPPGTRPRVRRLAGDKPQPGQRDRADPGADRRTRRRDGDGHLGLRSSGSSPSSGSSNRAARPTSCSTSRPAARASS